MSKKLIAVASAAALALTALVGIAPANAAEFKVDVTNLAGQSPAQETASTAITPTGISAAAAYNINVPSSNVIRSQGTGTEAEEVSTAAKFVVTTTTARGQVDITATGGVRLITEDQLAAGATVATGTTSLTDFSSADRYEFYAINTSTTAGTVVVSNAGNSKTIYLAGVSTFAYKMNLTSSASAALGGKIIVSGTVKDAFGNDLTTAYTEAQFVTSTVGATAGFTAAFPASTTWRYTAATKLYEWAFTAPTTATPVAIQLSFKDLKSPTAVTAFGTPVASAFFTVNAVDLATRVAALEAQVASLTADYNKLATRWNTRFDLKKAPKKKVALK
jgi:hypothetical protein